MNIIFIAPPAAGKGTQSFLLEEKSNYKHISTGDLLREERTKKTELGANIESIISKGELVSDEIITTLLKNELKKLKHQKFILDGYPRNIAQAETLENIFNELNIENYGTIYLSLDEETATKRALGRIVCSKCGAKNPRGTAFCVECGNKLDSSLISKSAKGYLIPFL